MALLVGWLRAAAGCAALVPLGALAADGAAANFELAGGYESLSLPAGESMGLASIALRHAFTPNFSAGVASYAAVRGERGGFITLGLTGEGRWPLGAAWSAEAGGFVGAGGGRGGYALSGGGLMLRAHAGLAYDTTALGLPGRWSVGASHVRFPDGAIRSNQAYVAYTLPFNALARPGWSTEPLSLNAAQLDGLAPRAHELAVVARALRVTDGTRADAGAAQADFTLLGAEWRTWLGPHTYVRFETEGAMGGGATGYMQILAGGGVRLPLARGLAAHATVAVGAGGGGGVDTGGGFLLDAGLGLQLDLGNRWFAELAAQHLRAPSGELRANSAAVKLGYRFGPATADTAEPVFEPHALRLRAVNQSYFQAADNWRSHHADQSVQNLGVAIDAFLSPNLYLTGQGLAAWRGDAGAYMTGQVGAGLRQPLFGPVFAEAELLFGAAGGGGLAMGSGAVVQANAGVVWQASDALSLHLSAGELRAINGDFRAHVVGLALGYRFTAYARR